MKDGRTHVAHKAEHAVDLETGAVVGVTVQDADAGDTTTMVETLITAAEQVDAVLPDGAGLAEVVGDTGYHSNATLVALADVDIRSYVSEPARGRRHWHGSARLATRRTAIGGGFRAPAGNSCCANAANDSNVPTPISTKPDGCAACICAAIPTSSSACWCTSAARIWAYSCDT